MTEGSGDGGLGRRIVGLAFGGGILGALFTVAVGALAQLIDGVWPSAGIAEPVVSFQIAIGMVFRIPIAAAGLALLRGVPWAHSTGARLAVVTAGVATLVLAARIPIAPPPAAATTFPATARAKSRAILKWSYRTPATVAHESACRLSVSRIPVSSKRNGTLKVLAYAPSTASATSSGGASASARLPVRDSLGMRLREALGGDSVEGRARRGGARAVESAANFGVSEAAAETLAAILDRAGRPDAVERMAWLALDAAAGAPNVTLKAAAARFAATTSDTDLAQAARQAARTSARVDSGGAARPAL